MKLSTQDRIDITDLINLHGHLTDSGALDEWDRLFTPDVVYDVRELGFEALHGIAALREAALALGAGNPVGHHVTNIVITAADAHSARVRSKGIGVMADGTAHSVTYDDTVTRRDGDWRISHRTVLGGRTPLGGPDVDARTVLTRWRRAAVDQSIADMSDLYAVDAIHEFPFHAPGVPARLTGRDAIVNWIAAGWRADALCYDHYRTLAVHDTGDPATIVVEQEVLGDSAVTGRFTLPNLVVLTVHDGRIVRLRDYVNLQAATAAIGREL